MVFNAYGTTDPDGLDEPGVAPTALIDAFLANKSQFRWINHTWSHMFFGCIQMKPTVVGESWTCAR